MYSSFCSLNLPSAISIAAERKKTSYNALESNIPDIYTESCHGHRCQGRKTKSFRRLLSFDTGDVNVKMKCQDVKYGFLIKYKYF